MTLLRATGVTKRFGDVVALDEFDLDVEEGVLLALLGPSGCGKTTALRVIAGLERPSAGEVRVGGRLLEGPGVSVPPEERHIGMVFQDWALFPHLTVAQNVAFGLPRGQERRVRDVLAMVHLEGLEDRMPHELSGGQQQRVALARALAPSPALVLLDEPFSNLDAALRASVRAEVREVIREAGITAVFVTHDREEALSISDRIAVMTAGRVLQTGTPQEVYTAPVGRRVAELVGDVTFVAGEVRDGAAVTPLGAIPATGRSDGPVEILIRPEFVRVEADPAGDASVTGIEFYGHDQLVRVALADGTALDSRPFGPRSDLRVGTRVRVTLDGPAHVLPRGATNDRPRAATLAPPAS